MNNKRIELRVFKHVTRNSIGLVTLLIPFCRLKQKTINSSIEGYVVPTTSIKIHI